MLSRALILVLLAAPSLLRAQQPVDLSDADDHLWEHRLSPDAAIHLSAQEVAAQGDFSHDAVGFQIVVSPEGRVESAVPKQLYGRLSRVPPHLEEAQAIELARTFKPWLKDGVPIRVRVQDYVSLLPPERWSETRVPFPEDIDLSTVTIGLKREAGGWGGPVYAVKIMGDGTVRYQGDRSVVILGSHTAHVSQAAVDELLLHFRKADFFSALDKYEGGWTDNPTQIVSLTIGPRTKTISDYVGLDDGLPLAIRNLEDEIDTVVESERWTKTNDATLASLQAEHYNFSAATPQNIALYANAVGYSNQPLIGQFLAARAPVLARSAKERSPVCVASGDGGDYGKPNLPLVRSMVAQLKQGAVPTPIPQVVRDQCLTAAARTGELALFQFWLDAGANPKATPARLNDSWMTELGPLPNAIVGGNPQIVRKLLDAGVALPATVQQTMPLLSWTIFRSRGDHLPEIIDLLTQAGADPNARDELGQTPLFDVWSHTDAIQPLLAAGAELEARDKQGNTPLMRQAFQESQVRELLAAGANPAVTNQRGETPLSLAKQSQCKACAALIQAALDKRIAASTPPNL